MMVIVLGTGNKRSKIEDQSDTWPGRVLETCGHILYNAVQTIDCVKAVHPIPMREEKHHKSES